MPLDYTTNSGVPGGQPPDIDGLFREDLREELGRIGPSTTGHLMEIANKWAKGEDSVRRDRTRPRDDDLEDDARYQDDPEGKRERRRR